jgi:hypothetical protein
VEVGLTGLTTVHGQLVMVIVELCSACQFDSGSIIARSVKGVGSRTELTSVKVLV